jgi:excisionase family DNA binding protein
MKRRRSAQPDDEAAPCKPLTVSVREAVRLSGLGRSTIWKCIKSGVLTSIMVGHQRLIVFASLEALLLGRKDTPEQTSVCCRWDEMGGDEKARPVQVWRAATAR